MGRRSRGLGSGYASRAGTRTIRQDDTPQELEWWEILLLVVILSAIVGGVGYTIFLYYKEKKQTLQQPNPANTSADSAIST